MQTINHTLISSLSNFLGKEEVEDILIGYLDLLSGQISDITYSKDMAKGALAAHTLKGTSYNVGAVRLGDLAYSLEKAFKAHDMSAVASYRANLQNLADETANEIRRIVSH
jgi:HPt (histidine-containing phosphotransfer) domain-containing protein